jgi:uncharacterized RDD family membrane protein YckC
VSVRTHPDGWVSAQGNYAGAVSRLVAYLIDLLVSTVIFQLALASISFVWSVFTGHGITWHRDSWVVIVTYVLWQFVYFGFQWAANGKSLGMTLLGVHIVQADGTRLEPRQGWLRSLTFPLGFLTLGLGFLGILVQREHRAVYDLIAGTAVVYAWDARAARLRFLARQAEPVADAVSLPAGPGANAGGPPPPSPPPPQPVAVASAVSDATQPIPVTADAPGPADPASSQAGSDALAGPGQEHPEPSSKGDVWPTPGGDS